jgi:hypothetical protein
MAFTCYASLDTPNLGSVGPPAQIGMHATYFIVNTTTNTAIPLASGEMSDGVSALLNTPINNQASILPAVQAAIQAQESSHPGLSFIWVGL